MTIAIALKTGDGVVLGTDSASTLLADDGSGSSIYYNSYFTAEKQLNLVYGLPVGLATYGVGGFGGRSTIRLTRDLRDQLGTPHSPYRLAPDSYTMEEAAAHLRRFFFTERYQPEYASHPNPSPLGFFLAGYSAKSSEPEVWHVHMQGEDCPEPMEFFKGQPQGLVWNGQGEALTRLVRGHAGDLPDRLVAAGMSEDEAVNTALSVAPLWNPAMPVQDAIDLVKYLADVTCGYVRFSPGELTVAPPIDLAAITIHEGFRWVARKHYFPSPLNPSEKYTSPPPRLPENYEPRA